MGARKNKFGNEYTSDASWHLSKLRRRGAIASKPLRDHQIIGKRDHIRYGSCNPQTDLLVTVLALMCTNVYLL